MPLGFIPDLAFGFVGIPNQERQLILLAIDAAASTKRKNSKSKSKKL
ncbi:MAG TPA: hypothetical protein VGP62_13265 [Bryobacteraceae bacterium]|jgi:hypothetical protein|nr:hypothetical protein [Bryobacteraceae bacterium]